MHAFAARFSLVLQIGIQFGERHCGGGKGKRGVVQCLGHAWGINGVEPRQTCDENGCLNVGARFKNGMVLL
jgi:hypothetical protein